MIALSRSYHRTGPRMLAAALAAVGVGAIVAAILL
jgi:hypothetical protein